MKNKLNSKEWLTISISIFLGLMVFASGIGIDNRHLVLAKRNIFEGIARFLAVPKMDANEGIFIMLLFISVFIVIFPVSLLIIKRLFKKHEEPTNSVKAWCYYVSDFLILFAVAFGLGMVFQIPNGGLANFDVTMRYTFASFSIGLFIFIVVSLFIYGAVGIIYFFFLNKKHAVDDALVSDSITKVDDESKKDLANSFTDAQNKNVDSIHKTTIQTSGTTSNGSLGNRELAKKEIVFKNLVAIDDDISLNTSEDYSDDTLTLKDLVSGLQGFLATKYKLYYDKKELVQFVAGMAASKFIILEGISGTGKSSLPRYFAKYISEDAYFEPIQVTYREKNDILGFFNELTGKYNETPFLKRLYRSTFETNKINLMVLDEMNISRIEYYFADFLSIMEFPENERYIPLMSLPVDYDAPTNLTGGNLLITPNTYFIGTANKDDSTFTITDKVIDRAIVINFDSTQKELSFDKEFDPIALSYNGLNKLFLDAQQEFKLDSEDKNKLLSLLTYISDELGIVTGNRIIKQIEDMAPIYVASGYKSEDCFDAVIASKVLRKLESKFDQGLSNSLNKLNKMLDELYPDSFTSSKRVINKILRRLI